MEERLDTFPRLLLHHARVRPAHPATREKDLGIWQTWTWREVADEVRALACGLAAHGFARGMHLAIVGDNRPRLYWAMIAAQCLGGVPVPLYQDAPAAEMAYVLNDAEIALRARRGPGAGRQAARGCSRRCPTLRAHRTTTIRAACATTTGVVELRRSCSELGREFDRAHPGFFDARGRARPRRRRRRSCCTRPAPPASRRACARRTRAFIAAAQGGVEFDRLDRRRQRAVVPADGVGRRPPVLVRAGLYAGFTDQLPRVGRHGDDRPARDRPDLLLRAAARVREPADAGDDPHGGCRRASSAGCSAHFMDVARRCGAEHPRRQAGVALADRAAVRARQPAGLRPAAQRARHEPHPRRLHRRRGDRPRPVPLLPLDRHQPEAALRLDRDLRVRVPAAGRRASSSTRVGQPAPGVEVKLADNGEVLVRGADAAEGVLQAARRDRRSRSTPTATSTPATPASSTRRPPEDHRPRQGRRQARRAARCSRPTTSRTSSSSSRYIKEAVAFGNGRDQRLRLHQHRHGRGRQLGRAARHRLLGLHRPRGEARGLRAGARLRREGQRRARRASRCSPTRRSTAS